MSTVTDQDDAPIAEIYSGRATRSILRGFLGYGPPDVVPDPVTIAALPVGRRFLTATTEPDFHAALDGLAEAWRAGGFGPAGSGYDEPLPTLDARRHEHHHRTYRDVRSAYAFDDGRVFYQPQARPGGHDGETYWYTLTLTRGLGGEAGVAVIPESRVYGESYPDTAALTLPQVAVWLLADLTRRAASDTSPIWPQVRFAVVVNTACDQIRLYLYGIDDTPGQRRVPTDTDFAALDDIQTVARAVGWTNPDDDPDRRFTLDTHVVADYEHPVLRQEGRTPGTVTVINDTDPFWH